VNEFEFDVSEEGIHRRCIAAEIQATGGQEETLILAQTFNAHRMNGEGSVFWRAVATSNSFKLRIDNEDADRLGPSSPFLSKFLRENLSLQHLHLWRIHLKEEHCRALATLERTDIKMALTYCIIEPENAENTFIDWFRHNQVVTELVCCVFQDIRGCFFSALSGNTSVKKLEISRPSEEEILSLRQALPGNMGIEHLNLTSFKFSDETWSPLFRSLAKHPRIKLLSLSQSWWLEDLSAESKSTMMKAILQMLHLNTVVQTIELPEFVNDEVVYQNFIRPRLEMNRTCFEVQRQAVKRADPSIRPQLLGRALHAVRYNADLVFQFLSENVPAFVRKEEVSDSTIPLQNDLSIVSGQKRKTSS
jgi:hypothetical protein